VLIFVLGASEKEDENSPSILKNQYFERYLYRVPFLISWDIGYLNLFAYLAKRVIAIR